MEEESERRWRAELALQQEQEENVRKYEEERRRVAFIQWRQTHHLRLFQLLPEVSVPGRACIACIR